MLWVVLCPTSKNWELTAQGAICFALASGVVLGAAGVLWATRPRCPLPAPVGAPGPEPLPAEIVDGRALAAEPLAEDVLHMLQKHTIRSAFSPRAGRAPVWRPSSGPHRGGKEWR